MNAPTTLTLDALFSRDADALGALGFARRDVAGGEVIWREGRAANELAWVEDGELTVVREADQLARVGRGELIGEASALIEGERRDATVQAVAPTKLWVLSRGHLAALRKSAPDVYDALLDAALHTLARRVETADREIARRSGWAHDALRAPVDEGRWPLAEPVALPEQVEARHIRALPGAATWSDDAVDAIARVAMRRMVGEGEALCVEGAPATSMYVLTKGRLRVLRERQAGDAVELAVVGTGTLLGTNALFDGRPRSASLVAAQASEGFELRREDVLSLPDDVRRGLLESLLVALRAQLVAASRAALLSRGSRATLTMEDAIQGLAGLEQWKVDGPAFEVALASLPQVNAVVPPDDKVEVFELIKSSIIGRDVTLPTPFGHKRVVYADYTASGRSLSFIEDYLRERVMPLYANTHSEASASGLQTTHFREEARDIIHAAVGGGDQDAVVFVGSGATGAIHKMLAILGLAIPPDLDARYSLSEHVPANERPVVFIGPYEHHSNILPWKESLADVEMIPLDLDGHIDLKVLEEKLVEYRDRPLRIGSFSAASNVTGIKTDTVAIATLLHRHGALSFWDYAGAGPYVPIEMNPRGKGVDASLAYKDAVFLSPHKLIGGPGTPGVLVVKRDLVTNTVPTQPGGGTVDFVTGEESLYASAIEAREEGGTPAILESIRCGLAFQLKEQVGAHAIEHMEGAYARRALDTWTANPAIRVLGNPDAERLSITAFMIRYGDVFVHHGFVVALLNDLFGVQARGGCSCAGPYGGMLLGLSERSGKMFLDRAEEGWLSLKPGWSRVNFNYFIGDHELAYIIDAVNLVAIYGWALMPHYNFDPRSGLWTHKDGNPYRPASLSELRIDDGEARWPQGGDGMPEAVLRLQLEDGRRVLEQALTEAPPEVAPADVPEEFEEARWFALPHEVAAHLRGRHERGDLPHDPDALRRTAYGRAFEAAKRGGLGVLDGIRRALRISPDEHADFTGAPRD